MSDRAPEVLFLGDTTDPWVAAIADALPTGTTRRAIAEGPVDAGDLEDAATIVIHRPILCARDGEAMRIWKSRTPTPPRLILCLGPNVRARDIEQWGLVADVILHESAASETLGRHLGEDARPRSVRPAVDVVGGTFETRRVTADACEAAGYPSRSWRDWDGVPEGGLVAWEVPVLEPGWGRQLREAAARRAVIAQLGFADRESVTLARANGAAACLDFPCDPADLTYVLDRVASRPAIDPPHAVPPPMKASRAVRIWAGPS